MINMINFLKNMCTSSFKTECKGNFNLEFGEYDSLNIESGIFLDCNYGCVDRKIGICECSEKEQDECDGYPALYLNFKNSKTNEFLNIVWYDNETENGEYIFCF